MCDDAFLVLERLGSRSALQCADIILGDAMTMTAAERWINATFATYPGCMVAGARGERGAWALFVTRTDVRLLVRAGRNPLSWHSITALARVVHAELVRR